MTSLIFVRHGETEWNQNGRWQGHTDVPLSDVGREQARRLARRLQKEGAILDQIYASDLGRALETAQIVAEAYGLPVHPLFELREMNLGSWSGLTSDQIRERFPEDWARHRSREDFRRGEHGETLGEMRTRMLQTVERLAAEHPGQRLLVVTHGGPIRVLADHIAQLGGGQPVGFILNTSLTEIVVNGNALEVTRFNDVAHLEEPDTEERVESL